MLSTLNATALVAHKARRPSSILARDIARCLAASWHVKMVPCGSSTYRPNYHNQSSVIATNCRLFHTFPNSDISRDWSQFSALDDGVEGDKPTPSYHFAPQRVKQKVIPASDAVSLVQPGDTVCVSGFVCQGAPEAILEALGQRYEETGSPSNLTLLFGGGPGDWDTRGLSHLAKMKEDGPPMLKRTIGSHYGQVPKVAELALTNKVQAWTLPLGSISRMIRAQATHSPGHITTVGLGTFVDPSLSGGAVNEAAEKSKFHNDLISKISIEDQDFLMYKALNIDVAFIRGTTADSQGNITIEEESLLCDQKITAAAARNSGGLVIAQVKRLAEVGSLPARDVAVPGPLVDCVVVVDEEDHDKYHPMSFEERSNPFYTGALRKPEDQAEKMPLDQRKLIARRAFEYLRPNTVVNLGIGLPEGVAAVAKEEDMLKYVTLTTEPGVFGGQPASGKSFGPSANATALVEMNQMFDFYDGGGLDMCFLGAAEIAPNGDVNVSRMNKDRLTGPGGFIDISQSTKDIVFLTPFTAKGLKLDIPGDGTLKIANEGAIKKFVPDIFEKTFSGDEAVRRGQTVYYVTERAVFRRAPDYDIIELIEIAPGVDLQKDVIDQMGFQPVVSQSLGTMDPRIFMDAKMKVKDEMFGSLEERSIYHEDDHSFFLELFGINIDKEEDIEWFINGLGDILEPIVQKKGPVNMVVNYDGFDIRDNLELQFSEGIEELQKKYYKTVKRFAGLAFHHAKLGKQMSLQEWDTNKLYDQFDMDDSGSLSVQELRDGMEKNFNMKLTNTQLTKFFKVAGLSLGTDTTEKFVMNKEQFGKALLEIFKSD